MPLPTLTLSHQLFGRQSVTSMMFWFFSILFSIVLHRVLVQHDRRSVLSWFSLFFRFGLNEFSIWFISTSCFVLRLNVDCFWFCFGSVLAFDLLPYSLGSCFGVFGLLFRFGFYSAFSFSFGLCLVLVLDSSYVYFVSILFSCCFVYGSIIRFQRSVFKCVDFGLFRISLRLSSASKSEGEKGEGRWIILRSWASGSGELVILPSWDARTRQCLSPSVTNVPVRNDLTSQSGCSV
jgi:hypothetical protein